MNVVGGTGSQIAGRASLDRSGESGGRKPGSGDDENSELVEGVHFDLIRCWGVATLDQLSL
jgi:hypothetical protein